MPDDEGFLRRWSRRKSESRRAEDAAGAPVAPAPAPLPGPALADAVPAAPLAEPLPEARQAPQQPQPPQPPTLADVARLTPDADFSAFVARGVDPAVRRGALKKLFADPHFHAMDGLDVYIDDYTKPSPVSEAMLASFEHARRVLMRPDDEKTGGDDEDNEDNEDAVKAGVPATPSPEDETP